MEAKKALEANVLLELHFVNVEGSHAVSCGRDICLLVCLLGQKKRSCLHEGRFPVRLSERLLFSQVYHSISDPIRLAHQLAIEHAVIELIQFDAFTKQGHVLATFECSALDFLYPEPLNSNENGDAEEIGGGNGGGDGIVESGAVVVSGGDVGAGGDGAEAKNRFEKNGVAKGPFREILLSSASKLTEGCRVSLLMTSTTTTRDLMLAPDGREIRCGCPVTNQPREEKWPEKPKTKKTELLRPPFRVRRVSSMLIGRFPVGEAAPYADPPLFVSRRDPTDWKMTIKASPTLMGRDHLIGKQITEEELEQMRKRFRRTTFNKKVNTDMVYPQHDALPRPCGCDGASQFCAGCLDPRSPDGCQVCQLYREMTGRSAWANNFHEHDKKEYWDCDHAKPTIYKTGDVETCVQCRKCQLTLGKDGKWLNERCRCEGECLCCPCEGDEKMLEDMKGGKFDFPVQGDIDTCSSCERCTFIFQNGVWISYQCFCAADACQCCTCGDDCYFCGGKETKCLNAPERAAAVLTTPQEEQMMGFPPEGTAEIIEAPDIGKTAPSKAAKGKKKADGGGGGGRRAGGGGKDKSRSRSKSPAKGKKKAQSKSPTARRRQNVGKPSKSRSKSPASKSPKRRKKKSPTPKNKRTERKSTKTGTDAAATTTLDAATSTADAAITAADDAANSSSGVTPCTEGTPCACKEPLHDIDEESSRGTDDGRSEVKIIRDDDDGMDSGDAGLKVSEGLLAAVCRASAASLVTFRKIDVAHHEEGKGVERKLTGPTSINLLGGFLDDEDEEEEGKKTEKSGAKAVTASAAAAAGRPPAPDDANRSRRPYILYDPRRHYNPKTSPCRFHRHCLERKDDPPKKSSADPRSARKRANALVQRPVSLPWSWEEEKESQGPPDLFDEEVELRKMKSMTKEKQIDVIEEAAQKRQTKGNFDLWRQTEKRLLGVAASLDQQRRITPTKSNAKMTKRESLWSKFESLEAGDSDEAKSEKEEKEEEDVEEKMARLCRQSAVGSKAVAAASRRRSAFTTQSGSRQMVARMSTVVQRRAEGRPTAVADPEERPSAIADEKRRPTFVADAKERPSSLVNKKGRPTSITDAKDRPSLVAIDRQLPMTSERSSRPSEGTTMSPNMGLSSKGFSTVDDGDKNGPGSADVPSKEAETKMKNKSPAIGERLSVREAYSDDFVEESSNGTRGSSKRTPKSASTKSSVRSADAGSSFPSTASATSAWTTSDRRFDPNIADDETVASTGFSTSGEKLSTKRRSTRSL